MLTNKTIYQHQIVCIDLSVPSSIASEVRSNSLPLVLTIPGMVKDWDGGKSGGMLCQGINKFIFIPVSVASAPPNLLWWQSFKVLSTMFQ